MAPLAETMTDHRARTLFALLPIALATGYSRDEPDAELLKVLYSIHLNCGEGINQALRTWTLTSS